MGLREEKKAETRGAILKAAERLFARQGYLDTRVSDIAARARVSEKTLFNYFASKEALLVSLAAEWFAREAEDTRADTAEAAAGDVGLMALLDANMRARARAMEAQRELVALVFMHTDLFRAGAGSDETPEQSRLRAALGGSLDALARGFAFAQERGEVRKDVDARVLARLFAAGFASTVQAWLVGGDVSPGSLERDVIEATKVFVDGCRSTRGSRS